MTNATKTEKFQHISGKRPRFQRNLGKSRKCLEPALCGTLTTEYSHVIPEKVQQDRLANETGFQCNFGKSLDPVEPDADSGLFC
jgi:hypothetical protein